ncbi:heme ABC exporter ATP-binding protein CcmA [Geobacillus sp. C56-T3]|uniref:heme ABC exporter ATP-binding protein CcmA n=1 Tax=Geobacillus sp. (strain C56-T3) TaxID=691437 RepID=UPI0001D581F8|nr:heme ABC exporter ATP-binding protein CcmA [Geobacillus sp. C56-T3]ADI25403.1 ABC transporter related protein [Geobacillus sp. C56-T3]
MKAIVLSNVSKTIKAREVLRNINLELESGKIYGFVGPNGSGKTMLFRVISGLVKPSSGTVAVFGQTLHQDVSFPSDISVLLEKPGFLEQYSGFDNLHFLAMIQNKIGEREVKEAIERVGLDPHDKRPVKAYSLGMRQRLAIAQCIMEKPQLMLLDEPMNGLDEKSVDQVYQIIREENKRGCTILLTSHNKVDIQSLCHEVYSMNEGVITGVTHIAAE